MSCNSCAKSFSILKKEKGCPGCGFSYCSKCLNNKVFLPKLNFEEKVCAKCKQLQNFANEAKKIEPPDAYYKRVAALNIPKYGCVSEGEHSTDQLIQQKLNKLKEDKEQTTKGSSEDEIAKRLQNIKGETSQTTDSELQARLARLRGVRNIAESKPILLVPDTRTEQEQADDLLKQYLEQTKINTKYKDEFDELVSDLESRVNKLKGSSTSAVSNEPSSIPNAESDDEEAVKHIIQKIKEESSLDDTSENQHGNMDELPFCEICNEDAKMRCLGCQYLFCKRCFLDHKDDDDGCNKYESYQPPKGYAH